MESLLPPDVFIKCLRAAGVWRNGSAVAAWTVSRSWRDAFWKDAQYPAVLASMMIDYHGDSNEAFKRASACRSAVVDAQDLARNIFRLVNPAGIQACGYRGQCNFYNNNDNFHRLDEAGMLWIPSHDLKILSARISCKWRDQGWGNLKGRLFIVLRRYSDESGNMEDVEGSVLYLFHGAAHEARAEAILLDETHQQFRQCILERQQPGDQLAVLYAVGGGGGHSLHVTDFVMAVAHTAEAAAVLPSKEDNALHDWRNMKLEEIEAALSQGEEQVDNWSHLDNPIPHHYFDE